MANTNVFPAGDDPNPDDYEILRKGSVYNIVGPHGREFSRFKSAGVVGPRWEELTHTPWPYDSSAYTPGMRLWELGIIRREHVGLRRLLTRPDPAPPPRSPAPPPNQSDQSELTAPTSAHAPDTEPSPAPDPPEPKTVQRPPRESASMQRTSKPVQQTLRPAKKYTRDQPKSDPPPHAEKPAPSPPPTPQPGKDSTPRQQRLMFAENWDDYRESIKPDPAAQTPDHDPADNPDADAEPG